MGFVQEWVREGQHADRKYRAILDLNEHLGLLLGGRTWEDPGMEMEMLACGLRRHKSRLCLGASHRVLEKWWL